MKFRTEIELPCTPFIEHESAIIMLGSCFTDNIGARLSHDGFDVMHNPFGPLFNPESICNLLTRCLEGPIYSLSDLNADEAGVWHCLDFSSRYCDTDADQLLQSINAQIASLRQHISRSKIAIITLGTAYIYLWKDQARYRTVGNCHKFPSSCFDRQRMSVAQVCEALSKIETLLPENIEHLIFTVSPVRHIGDGLHHNQLSKSILQLGTEEVLSNVTTRNSRYFPAYEILLDDLRDYRFYAPDLKHPSDVAVEYIYEKFLDAYCSKSDKAIALEFRKQYLHAQHRPIINSETLKS